MESIKNKHVIVTGGASGIGKATVELFLRKGAIVHAVDIDSKALGSLSGENLYTYKVDISDQKEVKDFFNENQFLINILVNNAGIDNVAMGQPFEHGEQQFELMQHVLAVNFLGAVYVTDFAVSRMIQSSRGKGGSIVFVSSVLTRTALSGYAAYKVSKHALVGYMQQVALECSRYAITANAVSPGAIFPTGINTPDRVRDNKDQITDCIPLSRFGTPEEIAEVVMNVATTPYMTGSDVLVDGGLLLNSSLNTTRGYLE